VDTVEGLRDAARRPELAARRGLGHRREIKLGSAVTQLGQLDTFTSIAERLGLTVDIEHLSVLLDEGIPVAFSEVEVGAAWGNPRPPASDRFFAAYQELNPCRPAGPSGCPCCTCVSC